MADDGRGGGDRGELLHYLEMMASMPPYPRWYQPDSGAECEELEDQRLRYLWSRHDGRNLEIPQVSQHNRFHRPN